MSTFLTITDDNFEAEVLRSKIPVLLDFTADWCPPCRALEPLLEGLMAEAQGTFRVGKINVDHNPRVTTQYGVRSAPTLITFVEGQPIRSHVGLTSKENLRRLVARSEGRKSQDREGR